MKRTKHIFALTLPLVAGFTMLSINVEPQGIYQSFNSAAFHQLNSAGASAGNAGAPGENNCTGCHAGSAASGAGFNVLEWADGINEYTPGETYTIQLAMTDASNKNGFQLVALKASDNTQAGAIVVTDEVRTQLLNGAAGKQYLGHRAAGNSSSMWSFDWTAPATNVGNVVFYVATNKTNSNGQASGDLIRLSQHTFAAPQSGVSLTAYEQIHASLHIFLNKAEGKIAINFTSDESEPLHVNILNSQGQSVLSHSLGMSYPGENNKEVRLNQTMSAGIYFVNFFVGNKAYSEKILID
jgi:hypothetical protein